MPAFSRLASSESQLPRSSSMRSLARTLVLMSAALGLIGLSDSASVTQLHQSHQSQPNELTPDQWQEKQLDKYLRTYPNGTTLSLSEYAEQLPRPFPFHCGIGQFEQCQIPPYAYESLRQSEDWWIVTSTINWNYYTNFLSMALKSSGKLAQSIVHHMLHDLVYEFNPETSLGVIKEMDLIRILLYPIEHGGNRDPTVSDATQIPDWLAAISPLASNAHSSMELSQAQVAVNSAKNKRSLSSASGMPPTNVPLILYNSSQPVETNLRELNSQMQHLLAKSVENKVNSPISLDTGIYGAISGGRFVGPKIDTPRLTSNADDIMRLIGVSAILNHENAMVVIKKSSCSLYRNKMKSHGPDRLQFCASDSSLIEIVKVRENTVIKDIYNAHLIESKYGFKTQFLASEALRCDQAIRQAHPGHVPENSDDGPYDVCTFQLPICNLQDEYLQQLLQDGKSIVEVCREDVGLAI
ncbi:hypothetical protein PCANC_09580 [Puccinia coronata f. sp. avenae]|uniref:DUF7872 domain-containing protein n=1 Tax=Puccinia coronata f. sp. avenae TaxID=200324 RepID=A0A2N5SN52_9BASI|nr:hypothetical protein PCANC_18344 [Puccinia coronata f. sp. avenae]PLW46736.1 hypothetical protein PCANC_09580 [Puccinia coronata f. sp. avenae]